MFGEILNIEPPDWMQGAARDLWFCLAPALCAQKVLQATDIQNLEVYCAAYGRFRQAECHIAKNGITINNTQGVAMKNPAVTVLNEAARQMAIYGALLGLDPSNRQRLIGPQKRNADDELKTILEM